MYPQAVCGNHFVRREAVFTFESVHVQLGFYVFSFESVQLVLFVIPRISVELSFLVKKKVYAYSGFAGIKSEIPKISQ